MECSGLADGARERRWTLLREEGDGEGEMKGEAGGARRKGFGSDVEREFWLHTERRPAGLRAPLLASYWQILTAPCVLSTLRLSALLVAGHERDRLDVSLLLAACCLRGASSSLPPPGVPLRQRALTTRAREFLATGGWTPDTPR